MVDTLLPTLLSRWACVLGVAAVVVGDSCGSCCGCCVAPVMVDAGDPCEKVWVCVCVRA